MSLELIFVPVKCIYILYTIYFLALSCMPCFCDDRSETAAVEGHSPAQQPCNKEKQPDENCTPFCSCASCVSACNHLIKSIEIAPVIFYISEKKYARLAPSYSSHSDQNIWQPPRLV